MLKHKIVKLNENNKNYAPIYGLPRGICSQTAPPGRDFGIDNDPLCPPFWEIIEKSFHKGWEIDSKFRPKGGEIVFLKTEMSKLSLGSPSIPPIN